MCNEIELLRSWYDRALYLMNNNPTAQAGEILAILKFEFGKTLMSQLCPHNVPWDDCPDCRH